MENSRRWISYVLLILAVIMIAAGIKFDEAALVFNKSVRICMECIGLG